MARAVEERERELVRSERLAAVGKMAAMITHEVRNPLSSIGLNTELLEDELDGQPRRRATSCRAIHREVDRLTAITEEYLAFARLPKPKLAPEAVNPMVGALAAFVRADLAAKKVDARRRARRRRPDRARSTPAQIRQCLINLVRNASEAVAAKGGGTVTLRTRRAGDRIAIEVEDDGAGIAADVLPRLFDPFFSTKEGGSGLGLALTQQIVKDHGGDLAVEQHRRPGNDLHASASRRGRRDDRAIRVAWIIAVGAMSDDDKRRERSRAGHAVRRVRGRRRSGRRLHREPVVGRHVRRDQPRAADRHADPARASFPGLLEPIAIEGTVRWTRGTRANRGVGEGEEAGAGIEFAPGPARDQLARDDREDPPARSQDRVAARSGCSSSRTTSTSRS